MAIAEGVNVPSVMPSGRPMSYISVDTNPDMFGAGVGRAVSELGGTIAQVAQLVGANRGKLQAEQDKIAANDAYVSAAIAKGQADANFYTKTGTNAVSGYEAYTAELAEIRKTALDSLGTDDAKRLFDLDFQTEMLSGVNGGATHAAKQQQAAVVQSAEQRLDLIQQDSATKFGDDALFAKNLITLDSVVEDLGRVQGWDEVTVVNKQFEQRSLAWRYRITAMANSDPRGAKSLFGEVRDGLSATDRIEIQNTVTSAFNNRAAAEVATGAVSGSRSYPTPEFVQANMESGLPGNVRVAIADNTRLAGMQPKAVQILHGSAGAAAEIGLTLVITAAEGGGHKSHSQGTEWDLKGYHADGRLWTPAERVYVARGGMAAGADRAGLYSFGEGYRGNGSLHIGYSGDGRPAAMWGHAGFTGGAESRNYTDPDERQLLADFGMGRLGAQRGVPTGSFRDRIIFAEGGGVGISSPKGAAGIMQVMPDTAAGVAAQLGIPFDPWRLKNDPDYNMLIGTTYLNQMLEMFQGDEVLAAAAYNAGPSRVWDWLAANGDPRNGTISHEEWISLIPFNETRGYVTKVMTGSSVPRVSGTGGGGAPASSKYAVPSQESFTVIRDRVLADAEALAPGDAVFASQALSEATTLWNSQEKAINEQRAENYDTVLGEAVDADSSGNLPTTRRELLSTPELNERWNALDAAQKKAIDGVLAGNIEPKPELTAANLSEYDRLKGMFFDPAGRAQFMREDLAANENLTPQQRKELIDLRWSERSEAAPLPNIDLEAALRIATPVLTTLEINREADPDEYNKFHGALIRVLTAEQARLGRPLKDLEMHDIIQSLLVENTYTDPNAFWSWNAEETRRVYEENDPLSFFPGQEFNAITEEVPITARVPPDIRKMISDAYVAKTGNVPTEAMIQNYYLQGLAKMKGAGK